MPSETRVRPFTFESHTLETRVSVLVSAYSGVQLHPNWNDVHNYVEHLLGRTVKPSDFQRPEFQREIQKTMKSRKDFDRMCSTLHGVRTL